MKKAYKAFWWLEENHEWVMNNLDISLMKVNPLTNKIDDDKSKNTKYEYWLETGPWVEDEDFGMIAAHDYQLDCGGDTFEEAVCFLAKNVESVYGKKTDIYGKAITKE